MLLRRIEKSLRIFIKLWLININKYLTVKSFKILTCLCLYCMFANPVFAPTQTRTNQLTQVRKS